MNSQYRHGVRSKLGGGDELAQLGTVHAFSDDDSLAPLSYDLIKRSIIVPPPRAATS